MDKREKGKSGEQLARDFLLERGMTLLAENYCVRGGEIDLIFADGDALVFVEVKTRYSSRYGSPLEAVTATKMRNVIRTAQKYIHDNGLYGKNARFDVVGIDRGQIEYIKNAFDASGYWG